MQRQRKIFVYKHIFLPHVLRDIVSWVECFHKLSHNSQNDCILGRNVKASVFQENKQAPKPSTVCLPNLPLLPTPEPLAPAILGSSLFTEIHIHSCPCACGLVVCSSFQMFFPLLFNYPSPVHSIACSPRHIFHKDFLALPSPSSCPHSDFHCDCVRSQRWFCDFLTRKQSIRGKLFLCVCHKVLYILSTQ